MHPDVDLVTSRSTHGQMSAVRCALDTALDRLADELLANRNKPGLTLEFKIVCVGIPVPFYFARFLLRDWIIATLLVD